MRIALLCSCQADLHPWPRGRGARVFRLHVWLARAAATSERSTSTPAVVSARELVTLASAVCAAL